MKTATRPVPLRVDYLGTGEGPFGDTRAGFHVTTELDRDQFGIIWNQSLLAGAFASSPDSRCPALHRAFHLF